MNDCQRTREQIHDWVDRELDREPAAEIARHIEDCSKCAEIASSIQSLKHLVRAKAGVGTGSVPPRLETRVREAIALERTSDTGLRHTDGTLSMARAGPDTAQSQFFVCIGEQPALDFGGHRNPDGQGFAAFGRVTEGMDIVRQIQGGALEGQRLVEPIRIESIRRRP